MLGESVSFVFPQNKFQEVGGRDPLFVLLWASGLLVLNKGAAKVFAFGKPQKPLFKFLLSDFGKFHHLPVKSSTRPSCFWLLLFSSSLWGLLQRNRGCLCWVCFFFCLYNLLEAEWIFWGWRGYHFFFSPLFLSLSLSWNAGLLFLGSLGLFSSLLHGKFSSASSLLLNLFLSLGHWKPWLWFSLGVSVVGHCKK